MMIINKGAEHGESGQYCEAPTSSHARSHSLGAVDLLVRVRLGPPVWMGGEIWKEMAFYTLAGGIAGALLAAVPGLIDYRAITTPKVKRIAMAHMIVNLVVVLLFVVNFGLRMQDPLIAGAPIILSALALLLLGIGGWLGGELVYIYGVAVEPSDDAPRQREREKERVVGQGRESRVQRQ